MTWVQYDKDTGFIGATNSARVSEDDLSAINRAQLDIGNQIFEGKMVDVNTLELIDAPISDQEE